LHHCLSKREWSQNPKQHCFILRQTSGIRLECPSNFSDRLYRSRSAVKVDSSQAIKSCGQGQTDRTVLRFNDEPSSRNGRQRFVGVAIRRRAVSPVTDRSPRFQNPADKTNCDCLRAGLRHHNCSQFSNEFGTKPHRRLSSVINGKSENCASRSFTASYHSKEGTCKSPSRPVPASRRARIVVSIAVITLFSIEAISPKTNFPY